MSQAIEIATAGIVRTFGLTRAPAALVTALTHPSYANEHKPGYGNHRAEGPAADNQRLEFLGDAVLDLCVSELLLERLPDADEGVLSRAYGALVNADALADWARKHDVAAALRVGKGGKAGGIADRTNVLADAVEAIVAAIYLDGGIAAARRAVELVVADGLGRLDELSRPDAKTELQEVLQAQGRAAPTYRVISEQCPPHDRQFVVGVEIDGVVIAEAPGRSKKLAEQSAARLALERYRATPPAPPTSNEP